MLRLSLLIAALLLVGCHSAPVESPKLKLGIDVLRDSNFAILAGKRVGLVAHPASVDSHLQSDVDLFKRQDRCKLVALFGPEHGFYGDEYGGDQVADRIDPGSGLPIYSLYGKTRVPTTQMAQNIDAFVFDLQDIGCRSYTFVGTMKSVMQRCAADDIELVILDRPNPLGGNRIEGPSLDPKFTSFVSATPTPYVHGMTMGELALMIRDSSFPQFKKLTIVKMQGWRREMTWRDTGLSWVPTSPHIPQARDAAFYVATGIIGELLILSNGVGYTLPFEIVGAPWINGDALGSTLNQRYAEPGVVYRPIRFKPFFQKFSGEACEGVQIHLEPDTSANLVEINFKILQALDAPSLFAKAEPSRFTSFDKVCGSDEPRKVLMENGDSNGLFAKWRRECEAFRNERGKYLLY